MEIKKDQFMELTLGEGGRTVALSAKYDRIDHFNDLGGELGWFILKVFDDEAGLIAAHLESDEVDKVQVALIAQDMETLPVIERSFIFKSEYNGFLESATDALDDSMFDFSMIDEDKIIQEETE
jgi:hypothetical protein